MVIKIINGIPYKLAPHPHDNKVLFKPAGDWIKCGMSATVFNRHVSRPYLEPAAKTAGVPSRDLDVQNVASGGGRAEKEIKRALVESKTALTANAIIKLTKIRERTVYTVLSRMRKRGEVQHGIKCRVEWTRQPVQTWELR